MLNWRMHVPCADCPFATSGAGLHLRKCLAPGRWRSILRALRSDAHFTCHKTTDETGNGTNLVCAGALEWQAHRGLSSNYQRVMEALDYFRRKRNEQRQHTTTPECE